jgi:hypothetical protein
VQGGGPVLPVLYGTPYDPFMKFDLDLMIGLDPDATEALKEMKRAVDGAKVGLHLDAGDLLIVDNRRTIHGRTSFKARYDGMDRWLQRVYVLRDLALCEEDRHRGERILHTEFSIDSK